MPSPPSRTVAHSDTKTGIGAASEPPLALHERAGLDKSGAQVAAMFDAIAPTYDLLNHLLSANQDARWRRRAVTLLCPRPGELVLDLCCGTGDSTRELRRAAPRCRVIGADFSVAMLKFAARKEGGPLVAGDALRLPFASGSFDAVTASFGVRNFEDTRAGLREMARLLRPGGRIMVLEFMRPASPIVRAGFGAFNFALAPIGRAVSGHGSAYNYLPQSIDGFYTKRDFERLLREMGFSRVRSFDFLGGIATCFIGQLSA